MILYWLTRLISIVLPFGCIYFIQDSHPTSGLGYVIPLSLSVIGLSTCIGSYDSGQIYYTSSKDLADSSGYLSRLLLYGCLGYIIASATFRVGLHLAIALLPLLIADRIYDEVSRYFVIRKKYFSWSILSLVYKLTFFIQIALYSYWLGLSPLAILTIASFVTLALVCLAIYFICPIFYVILIKCFALITLAPAPTKRAFAPLHDFLLYNTYIVVGFVTTSFLPALINFSDPAIFEHFFLIISLCKLQVVIFEAVCVLSYRQQMIDSKGLREIFYKTPAFSFLSPFRLAISGCLASMVAAAIFSYVSKTDTHSIGAILLILSICIFMLALNFNSFAIEWSLRKGLFKQFCFFYGQALFIVPLLMMPFFFIDQLRASIFYLSACILLISGLFLTRAHQYINHSSCCFDTALLK